MDGTVSDLTMSHSPSKPGPLSLPRQHNLQQAVEYALGPLAAQSADQLAWLGAHPEAQGAWRVRVLDGELVVQVPSGQIRTAGGGEINPQWRILVLHYLCVTGRPPEREPQIGFGELADARAYVSVYHKRVIERFCATAGRDETTLRRAMESLGGLPAAGGGDAAFDLRVFPRLVMRVIWHHGDEEFPPSATMLLPPNVQSFLCSEDVVVLSERVVSRLGGRPF